MFKAKVYMWLLFCWLGFIFAFEVGALQGAQKKISSFEFPFLEPIRFNVISEKLSMIPPDEREAIGGFLHLFLLKNGGAYTLFGDKPVSYDCYFEVSISDYSPFNRRYLYVMRNDIKNGLDRMK
ncbi:MAG: hypothetical protein HYZ48_02910 [Chlamydiales bacterium]|nr:hypothetical protein [Chlamydiales bacterium]